jgi:hypothetical protein
MISRTQSSDKGQVFLQLRQVVVADADLGKLTEPGIDAVYLLTTRDDFGNIP